ncbi:TonB-dependent receptor [Sphingobium boeckii]|uniref:Outer membrane receptor protein involved in Fe transport n=1 Tax=Sphingobium boeckii TaxID=1082345 RepID=A0A7W9AGM7_9SPHN|nr:TonB-dependent receptor [Sphingobium boeckii]MBB5685151.1 outer membrane receptor protein involved in Fe transport [Sphingobium boeckii]
MKLVLKLVTGVAFCSLATGLVHAQTESEATPLDAEPVVEDQYADIVVTATGRAQRAQDVPLAVSVIGGEALENSGISDIRGLRQVTPSLQVTTGQSSATGVVLRIRGIGTAGDNPGFEPAVGVFIDGVFRARAGVALADLPPIDRVEVLRGPQGTLFGRNTSAGALSITTQGPSFDLGGYAEASYGNLDEMELKAGVTGPVSETIALRVDGGYHKRDGYIKDANVDRRFNNLDRWFVRGQAKYESGDVTVRLIGDYAETDESCCGALNTGSGFAQPGTAAFAASSVVQGLAAANGRVGIAFPFDAEARVMAASPNRDLSERVKEWGISGQVDWDLGDVTLTSVTAWRDWKARRNQDIDFSGVDRAYREGYQTGLRDFTQEIRLKGSAFNDHLDWLVGGFYLNEKNTLTDRVRFGTQGDAYVDNFVNALTDAAVPGPGGFQLFGTIPGRPLVGQVLLASNAQLAAAAGAGGPAVLATFLTPFPSTPNGAGQVADRYRVDTEAFALFTHNIINFNDNISLTLGLRYNHETKDIDANLNSAVPACAFLQGANAALLRAGLNGLNAIPGADGKPTNLGDAIVNLSCNPTVNSEFNGLYDGGRSESVFTGTAKLAFKLSDDVLVYGGYDRGYKSGGYNLDRSSFDSRFLRINQDSLTSPLGDGAQIDDLEFGKESVDSFEVGVKTNFSRAIQFNASAFYADLRGYQNLVFTGSFFEVQNFKKLISKGIELESIFRPASDLTVSLNYTLLDTEVKDAAAGADNNMPLTNSPKHVVTGAVTWTPQLSDSVGGLVHVDWRTQSDANTLNDPVGVPFTTNDGHSIVNARVGVNFGPNQNFGVEAYVENLFDRYFNITSFPIPEQSASFAVYPSPPRLYGVKLRARF